MPLRPIELRDPLAGGDDFVQLVAQQMARRGKVMVACVGNTSVTHIGSLRRQRCRIAFQPTNRGEAPLCVRVCGIAGEAFVQEALHVRDALGIGRWIASGHQVALQRDAGADERDVRAVRAIAHCHGLMQLRIAPRRDRFADATAMLAEPSGNGSVGCVWCHCSSRSNAGCTRPARKWSIAARSIALVLPGDKLDEDFDRLQGRFAVACVFELLGFRQQEVFAARRVIRTEDLGETPRRTLGGTPQKHQFDVVNVPAKRIEVGPHAGSGFENVSV